ncbi:hypothetical protein ACS0TY_001764 [Phlomoides rotata]
MEALFPEFTFLSDEALRDRSFDPSTIEDLMKLFEIEAYKAWANLELESQIEAQDVVNYMEESEDYLDSVMESAMAKFRSFDGLSRLSFSLPLSFSCIFRTPDRNCRTPERTRG